jgi:hypothetical protein
VAAGDREQRAAERRCRRLARSIVGRDKLAAARDRHDPHQWPSGLLPAHALDASPRAGVLVAHRTANATRRLRKFRERPLAWRTSSGNASTRFRCHWQRR